MRATIGILVAAAVLVILLAACGTDAGSPSAAPGSVAPATTAPSSSPATPAPTPPGAADRSPSPPSPPATGAPTPAPSPAAPFSLRSGAFAPGSAISARYTCDGADASPDLSWTGVPVGTQALVLVVDDPDAGGFVHWIVLDMPPGQASIARGAGAVAWAVQQGTNDFGAAAWGGPCPPSGDHRYRFTLYALAAPLGLRDAPAGAAVRSALASSTVLGRAVLTAHYRRGG